MTSRTAQALYTLASLRLQPTTPMTTHWDSINMTGEVFPAVFTVNWVRPGKAIFSLVIKCSYSLGEYVTCKTHIRVKLHTERCMEGNWIYI